MNFDSDSVALFLSEKRTDDDGAWKNRFGDEVLTVELLFQSTKRVSRVLLRLLPEAANNSPNWKCLDDDEDINCRRVKGAMMPSSSSHRLVLEEKRKTVDGAKLKKRSFAVFLFLIEEEKEEDASGEKLRRKSIFPVVVVINCDASGHANIYI